MIKDWCSLCRKIVNVWKHKGPFNSNGELTTWICTNCNQVITMKLRTEVIIAKPNIDISKFKE